MRANALVDGTFTPSIYGVSTEFSDTNPSACTIDLLNSVKKFEKIKIYNRMTQDKTDLFGLQGYEVYFSNDPNILNPSNQITLKAENGEVKWTGDSSQYTIECRYIDPLFAQSYGVSRINTFSINNTSKDTIEAFEIPNQPYIEPYVEPEPEPEPAPEPEPEPDTEPAP